ncbi:C39 family peptidase [Virgibacillus halophilus]|uniref:C39 family peptidase n=1 Tax=Tigheibacillus halophilus TaxID=361280 RepID=A0ABU5C2J6_9BACI|nr:C39 family peptidase [Virgibacillus halophilus]
MEQYIFLFSMVLALLFIFGSKQMTSKWIKKSFIIYGLVFFIAAVFSGISFFKENKTEIYNAMATTFPAARNKTETPKNELISQHQIKATVKLEAPMIQQLPELPRGCEVTSLSMLLAYHDISVDKMKLAEEITKNPAVYKETKKRCAIRRP